MFGLQEILSALGYRGTIIGTMVVLVALAFGYVIVYIGRKHDVATLLSFLCVLSCLWMYHGHYDFVLLAFPFAIIISESIQKLRISESRNFQTFILFFFEVVAMAVISLALSPFVYGDEQYVSLRLVRWCARILLFALLIREALSVLEISSRKFSFRH